MGTRYVEVPADQLLGTLKAIGEAVAAKGGRYSFHPHGSETVFELTPPNSPATVRVYTTLAWGDQQARGCGEDAVRVFLAGRGPVGTQPLTESDRMLRTAPAGGDRVAAFLERLTAKVREFYLQAAKVPACPTCGRPMVKRTGPHGEFFGCKGFPECRTTKS